MNAKNLEWWIQVLNTGKKVIFTFDCMSNKLRNEVVRKHSFSFLQRQMDSSFKEVIKFLIWNVGKGQS